MFGEVLRTRVDAAETFSGLKKNLEKVKAAPVFSSFFKPPKKKVSEKVRPAPALRNFFRPSKKKFPKK